MSAAPTRFAHERLDAYHVALELFGAVERLAAGLPRGQADLKDQIRRASAATVRHIAEAANRVHPRDKAARFSNARGDVGECAASIDMALMAGLVDARAGAAMSRLADRIAAMLCGLIRRESARGRR